MTVLHDIAAGSLVAFGAGILIVLEASRMTRYDRRYLFVLPGAIIAGVGLLGLIATAVLVLA